MEPRVALGSHSVGRQGPDESHRADETHFVRTHKNAGNFEASLAEFFGRLAKNIVAAKNFLARTRLAIEPLETRNLLTAGAGCSMAAFLASARIAQNSPPAIVAPNVASPTDAAPTMPGTLTGDGQPDISPQAATGSASVTTLEDTPYTFSVADFGFSGAAP